MNLPNEILNYVWKFLRDDRLEFDGKCSDNMICIICKKVLVNAHSAPCGCRYCLDCITNYLNGENKICPGNTDECKEALLNMTDNIHIEQAINMKILRMVVKCPEKNCEFKCELKKIEDHARICDSISMNCPYLNIGCKDSKIVNEDVKNHLLTEICSHTKLLFKVIDNLKYEIQILKDDNVVLKKDRDNLKKLINDSEIKNEKEKREIKEKLKEIENKLNEEYRRTGDLQSKYDTENRERKEKLEEIENELIEEQKKNVNELKKEIKLVKDETESIKRDASQNKRENERKIDEINKTMSDLKSIWNLENEVRVLEKKQEQQIGGEFVWRIDKWKEKLEQARAGINKYIYSDAFYSHRNGYKMCLNVYPNGFSGCKGTHLSVYFCLMRGEFDDILSWPFKHDVTFELINQHTTQIHTSETAKYDSDPNNSDVFQKPISDRNDGSGRGYPKFISLEELSNNLSLIDNDQIFIRCRVKID